MGKGQMEFFAKGMWIGGTMTVPGVSGGSMAMILGIYDKLIQAVSRFFRTPAESMGILFRFLAGAALGMVLFSRLITWLLTTRANVPLRFFFLGAGAGGIPMIYRKAGIRRLGWETVAYPAIGILAVVLLSFLPAGVFLQAEMTGGRNLILPLLGGVIIAAGLVLPGISVSQMLYMLGMYESIMKSISSLDILPLIPLGIGVAGGTFLVASLLEGLLKRYPQPAYLIILGFMLGSLPELYPGIPAGAGLMGSGAAAAAGFWVLFWMSSKG